MTTKKKNIDVDMILKLYLETKLSKEKYLNCILEIKKIKKNNDTFNTKANNSVSELKILLAYLKKHNELKLVYNSYKEVLKLLLQFKKKFSYYSHISKPLLSKRKLQNMVLQQNKIMKQVDELDKKIPDVRQFF